MSGGLQVPERYLLPEGVGAVVPGRVAALIHSRTNLGQLRAEIRGTSPEVDAVLMALHIAALKWRGSATGTTQDTTPEPVTSSEWLTTEQAAGLAGVSSRAIRKAIQQERLTATEVAGRYRISREDLEHYKAARAA